MTATTNTLVMIGMSQRAPLICEEDHIIEDFSKQNTVLLPNKDFGKRKFLHLGNSTGSLKSPGKEKSFEGGGIEETTTPQVLTMKSALKQWIHPQDKLLTGHIVYNVKFLGECEVDSAKGTDIVKDAIRKRKFNKHIRKAEGQKTPRVELTISADGVTIQDPKTKACMHQYPLHRISYCADDKTDKRMFTFIAKAADANKHYCYVFGSEKCAEEITLTIGQAFDLAYRRFLETSGQDLDTKKQCLMLQRKVQTLEQENAALKRRIQELENLKGVDPNQRIYANSRSLEIVEGSVTKDSDNAAHPSGVTLDPSSPPDDSSTENFFFNGFAPQPSVGTRLENLILDKPAQTNGSSTSNGSMPVSPGKGLLSPPPRSSRSHFQQSPANTSGSVNPFSSPGSSKSDVDPFGMTAFTPTGPGSTPQTSTVSSSERELMDMQVGFSAGLSFGTEDFSLADFDPLNQSS
ncbi:PTB domain-containing engulfment adapter protein 1-like isoform X1 [Saccostrea echinata]|uniref:PTB domain-containing engulfment adapter protein 1-like isoform X1 n=1 Tax=Saccostrea echinata TaxID=191078 RepID=UPI002A808FF1|nr:PTB domain-containing engulfment adapter protein 1-like isoform X1 [Saccostrea echinata]